MIPELMVLWALVIPAEDQEMKRVIALYDTEGDCMKAKEGLELGVTIDNIACEGIPAPLPPEPEPQAPPEEEGIMPDWDGKL
jgi:hypothetical protein